MKSVALYLLAALGGNSAPSADDLKKIAGSVGIELDAERVSKLLSELEGKNIDEVVAAGVEKLASVPSGGGVAAAAPAGGAAAGGAAEAKAEEKVEEEEDEDMGFSLFD